MKNPVWILCLKSNVVRSAGRLWRKPGGGIVHSAFFGIMIIFFNMGFAIFHSLPLFKTPLILFWVLPHTVLPLSSATIFKRLCATKISENWIKRTKEGSGLWWLFLSSVCVPPNILKVWMWKNLLKLLEDQRSPLGNNKVFLFQGLNNLARISNP